MNETKPIYKSKTAVVNAIIALAPLYPPVMHWVQQNPGTVLIAIASINVLLRLVTKGRITLFGSDD